jgi:hypothetical protein
MREARTTVRRSDREPQRQPAFRAAVNDGLMPPGLAVDDGVAVLITLAGPQALCSARPGAAARGVRAQDGTVIEEPLQVRQHWRVWSRAP